MKSLQNPPAPVKAVATCLLILRPNGNENEADGWNGAKIMMNDPGKLIQNLQGFDKQIHKVKDAHINKINKIVADPTNRISDIATISAAAAGLFGWVRSTVNLYEVHKKVTPLKKKVEEMTVKQQQLQEDLTKTE